LVSGLIKEEMKMGFESGYEPYSPVPGGYPYDRYTGYPGYGSGSYGGGESGNTTEGRISFPSINTSPPTYVEPVGYTPPDPYKAEPWDESKIESKTQRKAAPGLRTLRGQMQKVTGGYYENPNVKRMTLREAFAGYGQGLENVMTGAEKEAETEYAREYGIKAEEGKINYQTALTKAGMDYTGRLTKAQMDYQSQLAAYQNSFRLAYSDYMASTYGTGRGSSGGGKRSGVTSVSWAKDAEDKPLKPSEAFKPGSGISWGYEPGGYYDRLPVTPTGYQSDTYWG
jgi:hypothetical protein